MYQLSRCHPHRSANCWVGSADPRARLPGSGQLGHCSLIWHGLKKEDKPWTLRWHWWLWLRSLSLVPFCGLTGTRLREDNLAHWTSRGPLANTSTDDAISSLAYLLSPFPQARRFQPGLSSFFSNSPRLNVKWSFFSGPDMFIFIFCFSRA